MRHWRRRMDEWPPDWREAMEAECQRPRPLQDRLLPWLPDWALWIAVFGLLALIGWSSGFGERWHRTQNPTAQVSRR